MTYCSFQEIALCFHVLILCAIVQTKARQFQKTLSIHQKPQTTSDDVPTRQKGKCPELGAPASLQKKKAEPLFGSSARMFIFENVALLGFRFIGNR